MVTARRTDWAIAQEKAGCALWWRVVSHLCWLNVVGSPLGCVQHFECPCTDIIRSLPVSILNMCSFTLLLPVLSCPCAILWLYTNVGVQHSGGNRETYVVKILLCFLKGTRLIAISSMPFTQSYGFNCGFLNISINQLGCCYTSMYRHPVNSSDIPLLCKWTDVSNALACGILVVSVVPTGSHTSSHSLSISEDVELCDMMCATVFLTKLSCQQHGHWLSMIWGAEIANSFIEDYQQWLYPFTIETCSSSASARVW